MNERLPDTEPDTEPDTRPDVESLPGGARAALEAVLMVIDEPATTMALAAGLDLTVDVVESLLAELQRDYNGYTVNAPDADVASQNSTNTSTTLAKLTATMPPPGVLNCGISPEAGGSIPARSSPRSLADSCWKDKQPG